MAKDTKASEPQPKKGLNKTQVILIVGFVVVIALIIGVFVFLNRPEEEATGGNLLVTADNLDTIDQDLTDKAAEGAFRTYMTTDWNFPDGKSPSSNAIIGNSAANHSPFYFEISLEDTGEIVYTSDLIPIGLQVKELILEKDIPRGDYNAICTYYFVDESGNVSGDDPLGFNVRLHIEN